MAKVEKNTSIGILITPRHTTRRGLTSRRSGLCRHQWCSKENRKTSSRPMYGTIAVSYGDGTSLRSSKPITSSSSCHERDRRHMPEGGNGIVTQRRGSGLLSVVCQFQRSISELSKRCKECLLPRSGGCCDIQLPEPVAGLRQRVLTPHGCSCTSTGLPVLLFIESARPVERDSGVYAWAAGKEWPWVKGSRHLTK
jgi:hypothetical protein